MDANEAGKEENTCFGLVTVDISFPPGLICTGT